MYEYEDALKRKGYKVIGGCDEAGRGPLAGPLVVACVVLDDNNPIEGLNDSKKLSAKKRLMLYQEIKAKAVAYKIVEYNAQTVDEYNVYQASKRGMIEAASHIEGLEFLLTDAMPIQYERFESLSVIKGDQKSASIAAASILAKVTRDAYMDALQHKYPGYGFEKHKGYPTKAHMEALDALGVCAEHRKSFAPVKARLAIQTTLDI